MKKIIVLQLACIIVSAATMFVAIDISRDVKLLKRTTYEYQKNLNKAKLFHDEYTTNSIGDFVDVADKKLREKVDLSWYHSGRVLVIAIETELMNNRGLEFNDAILDMLQGKCKKAYLAEREAFSEWKSFQDTVARYAVLASWECRCGGTGGSDVYVQHLYDIAVTNVAAQYLFYSALSEDKAVLTDTLTATPEEIESAVKHMQEQFNFAYCYGDEENENHKMIPAAKETVKNDYELFNTWIEKRKELEIYLPKSIEQIYASHTKYWMSFYCRQYRGSLIGNFGF